MNSLVPLKTVYLLCVNFDRYLNAGIPNMRNPAYQFDDRTCRKGLGKTYFVRRNRNNPFSGKASCHDKRDFIHQLHNGTTKQRIIMVYCPPLRLC